MKLATYEHNGVVSFGVVVGEGIVDLTPRIGDKYSGVLELLRAEALFEAENAVKGTAAGDRKWVWKVRDGAPWTIDVEFPAPDATKWFWITLDRVSFSAPEMHSSGDAVDPRNWKDALGTGPFIPTDHVSGVKTTLKKNPIYWDKDPFNGEQERSTHILIGAFSLSKCNK